MSKKIENATALYLEGIRDGNVRAAVTKYTGDRYTQHSTGVRDGIDGFVEFFEDFIDRNPVRDIQIRRTLEDGRYLFVHAYQSLNDGEAEYITMDFFDTDQDDKIVEHWDVIAEFAGTTPSGHTAIDGPTDVTDLDRTDDNKRVVRGLIEDVLMPGGDAGKLDHYVSSAQYIQHNPDLADGLDPFRRYLQDPARSLSYDGIELLVGQGNFVATLSRANRAGAPLVQADLFRLEDGLIVEHWDATEPIGSESEWVNCGKF